MTTKKKLSIASIVLNNFTNDSRVLKEARTLQNNNYDVTVVALYQPPLKEYETVENFKVHRIKLTSRPWSKNKIVQLLKYFEFVFRTVKKYKSSDVFHCHDLNALPIGVIIKLFFNKKAKVVYDAHEYETETNGLRGIRKKISQVLERLLIKYADTVITVSDSIAKEYVRLYKIKKPSLVLNTPLCTEITPKNLFREKFDIEAKQKIFLYQGSLSAGRGIEILLDAFQQFKSNSNVIVFMGYGELEEKVIHAQSQSNNIFFHQAVSPEVILDYTSSADFGISTIENSCLSYKYCLPNKIFEYIMAGVPVVCSNLPEMKSIVEKYKVGVAVKKNTTKGLIEAVKSINLINKKELVSSIEKATKIYNWEEQEEVLLSLYENIK